MSTWLEKVVSFYVDDQTSDSKISDEGRQLLKDRILEQITKDILAERQKELEAESIRSFISSSTVIPKKAAIFI